MFAEMMRVSGFRVLKLLNSTPAIVALSRNRPDVVILDVMMPDVSGLEVLRFMRRDPGLDDIPVIVVSAKSMPADIKIGLDAGATLYLTKPVGFLDLKHAVDRVIQKTPPAKHEPAAHLHCHRVPPCPSGSHLQPDSPAA